MNPITPRAAEALLQGRAASGDDALDELLDELRAVGRLTAPEPRADLAQLLRVGWAAPAPSPAVAQRPRRRRRQLIVGGVMAAVMVSGTATAAASQTVRQPLQFAIVKVVGLFHDEPPEHTHRQPAGADGPAQKPAHRNLGRSDDGPGSSSQPARGSSNPTGDRQGSKLPTKGGPDHTDRSHDHRAAQHDGGNQKTSQGVPDNHRSDNRAHGKSGNGTPGHGGSSKGEVSKSKPTRTEPTKTEPTKKKSTGPKSTGPKSTGPKSTGPKSTGPKSTGPKSTGPKSTGPKSTGPKSSSGTKAHGNTGQSAKSNGRHETAPGQSQHGNVGNPSAHEPTGGTKPHGNGAH